MNERFWIGFADILNVPEEKRTVTQRAVRYVQGSTITTAFLVFNDNDKGPVAYTVSDDNDYLRLPLVDYAETAEHHFYEVETCRAQRLQEKCEKAIGHGALAHPVKDGVEAAINKLIRWRHNGHVSVALTQPYHLFNAMMSVSLILENVRAANLEILPKWFAPPMWPATLKAFVDNDPSTFKPKKIIKSVVSL